MKIKLVNTRYTKTSWFAAYRLFIPHNYGGYIEQEYLKEDLKLFENSNIGFEKSLNEWLIKIKKMVRD